MRVLLTGTAELKTRWASRAENLWSKRQQRLHNRTKALLSMSPAPLQKLLKVSSTERPLLSSSSPPAPSSSCSESEGRWRPAAEGRCLEEGVPGPEVRPEPQLPGEASDGAEGEAGSARGSRPPLDPALEKPSLPGRATNSCTLEPVREATGLRGTMGGGGSSPRGAEPGGEPVGGTGRGSRPGVPGTVGPARAAGAEAGRRSVTTGGSSCARGEAGGGCWSGCGSCCGSAPGLPARTKASAADVVTAATAAAAAAAASSACGPKVPDMSANSSSMSLSAEVAWSPHSRAKPCGGSWSGPSVISSPVRFWLLLLCGPEEERCRRLLRSLRSCCSSPRDSPTGCELDLLGWSRGLGSTVSMRR
mmetsp:Transcript_23410/g.79294  ORF Transcript_23410/g.79294 Transcript_23410/m.79294 type:complete len:362 (+) Transcript_23410:978-2063(+)